MIRNRNDRNKRDFFFENSKELSRCWKSVVKYIENIASSTKKKYLVICVFLILCTSYWWLLVRTASFGSRNLRKEKREGMILNFLVHHKTGTHLADAIADALYLDSWEYRKDNHFPTGVNRDDNNWSWPVSNTFEHLFYNGTMKVLHFVRDPIDLIVSAYNYHRQGPELWLNYGTTHRWKDCRKRSTFIVDCLRSLKKADGLKVQTKNMMREIREMHLAFQVFARWPERSINICLCEFKRNLKLVVSRICNFLGPETCMTEEVVKSIAQNCNNGKCNFYADIESQETECRPTKQIGVCEKQIKNRKLENCIHKLEKKNIRSRYLSCCVDEVLHGVECYDKPVFEPATRKDVYQFLQKEPELLEELSHRSENMKCRLDTDTDPNLDIDNVFVDEELVNAFNHLFELSPETTEGAHIEQPQSKFKNIQVNFQSKKKASERARDG